MTGARLPPGRAAMMRAHPTLGAAAMATAVLSVALRSAGHPALSAVWLALAVAVWLALVAAVGGQLVLDRAGWRAVAATPPALTGVAATAVLGTRLSMAGWAWAGWALLVVALAGWLLLLPRVLRHWRLPAVGAGFLVCVATQGVVVLAGTSAPPGRVGWICVPGLAVFVLGLVLYGFVLARFELGQLRRGAGDQWVAGGALAISALAGATLVTATSSSGVLGWWPGLHEAVRSADLIVLGLALAWYAVLAASELRWPRPVYDARRWSTVFPLGMTALACMTTASATGVGWLRPLGEVLVWPALAAWIAVAAGAARRMTPPARRC
ncbi:tellurite resistance/C4-dicarboxylate transporter family protein [Pseudonocardia sp. H11422]|nr:tellurite resistance/C4-dicarboxylate transporter family protein [Pseudonocardia sp. H11422]